MSSDPPAPAPGRQAIGRSAVEVGRLGFGGSSIANLYRERSEAEVAATVAAAVEGGLRYFDTAPLYGFGLSERRLGLHLRGVPREQLVISSKVGRTLFPGHRDDDDGAFHAAPPFAHRFDFSYGGVMRQFEDSLQRLGMDRLDMVVIHDIGFMHMKEQAEIDQHFADLVGGGLRALVELRDDGRIGAIGAGANEFTVWDRFLATGEMDFFLLALRYTLLDQSGGPFLDSAASAGVSVVVATPFQSGILATGVVPGTHYNYGAVPERVVDAVRQIEAVCARHAVPLKAAALQFPLRNPAVASVLAGMGSAAEVRENLAAAAWPIPEAAWPELEEISRRLWQP